MGQKKKKKKGQGILCTKSQYIIMSFAEQHHQSVQSTKKKQSSVWHELKHNNVYVQIVNKKNKTKKKGHLETRWRSGRVWHEAAVNNPPNAHVIDETIFGVQSRIPNVLQMCNSSLVLCLRLRRCLCSRFGFMELKKRLKRLQSLHRPNCAKMAVQS